MSEREKPTPDGETWRWVRDSWSEPVCVKITHDDGRELLLEFHRVTP